jgi:hypothetical protein
VSPNTRLASSRSPRQRTRSPGRVIRVSRHWILPPGTSSTARLRCWVRRNRSKTGAVCRRWRLDGVDVDAPHAAADRVLQANSGTRLATVRARACVTRCHFSAHGTPSTRIRTAHPRRGTARRPARRCALVGRDPASVAPAAASAPLASLRARIHHSTTGGAHAGRDRPRVPWPPRAPRAGRPDELSIPRAFLINVSIRIGPWPPGPELGGPSRVAEGANALFLQDVTPPDTCADESDVT